MKKVISPLWSTYGSDTKTMVFRCASGNTGFYKDEMNMERENPHDVNPYDSKAYKRTRRHKKDRPNPRDVNPYDSKAIKRTKRHN